MKHSWTLLALLLWTITMIVGIASNTLQGIGIFTVDNNLDYGYREQHFSGNRHFHLY